MDSPESNRIPAKSSPSPAVQGSPFFNYISNLSPIRSAKAARYVHSFSQTNFAIPPPPVFTSPRIDPQRETSFRGEIDAAGSDLYRQSDTHLKPEPIHCFQKEDQSCSPSGCIDEYLADLVDMEDTTKSSDLCAQSRNDKPMILERFTSHKDTINKDYNHVDSHMFLGSFSGSQHHEKFLPQSIETYNDFVDSSRSALRVAAKDAQHQRGIRRHLQFGVTMSCKDTGNENHDTNNLSLPEGLTHFGSLVSYHTEPSGISNSWGADSRAQTVTFLSSSCPSQSVIPAENCGNHNISACTPSDLALPSIGVIRSDSMGLDSNASQKLVDKLHAREEKLIAVRNHSSSKDLDSILVSSVAGEIYAQVEDDQQETQAATTVSSAAYNFNSLQSPCVALHLTSCEQQVVPYDGRTLTSQNANMVEDQASPKRNRKRTKCINESEGCKRCNCKRSKCLKLYCECFAAGVYCLDSCACNNCFNRPDYEDTVLDTRQLIEARNPLAFAPKVVKHAMDSPANIVEEGNWTTPSSARHKRGCNCKKSKCLKKYCECYQARVGCSNGCRCEGCNNSFGKKIESIYRRAEKWKNPSHEQLGTMETQDDFIKSGRAHQLSSTWEELADMSHLTPLSHCHSGAVATSASLNIGDGSKVSQAHAYQERTLQSSAGYPHSHHSPVSPTTNLYRSKVLPDISSDNLLYDILEDDTRKILENALAATKSVKVSSPNQKRVSPPQIRSQELRSSSSQGLRSGRKFILPAVPSFPPLTPYSKLKDGIQGSHGDSKDGTSCQ
ncbi:hypothetical protein GH714_037697 [Hevea brasiliensis]|uniref:CRC domain-containing protein n=1 Tax=Hevea brasiliensis TaxID=3981 RepID=A0A6A6LM82_HEVBR|nr:hypothetical protein GH714_037697 [Hevea brasiliensis]